MLFDQLSDSYKLLRQIMLLIKSNDNDLSHLSLNEFLDTYANDQTIRPQREFYEIRDFQLCYLNHIQEFKKMIKVNLIDVEYEDVEKLKLIIHTINEVRLKILYLSNQHIHYERHVII
jgi:hypothetical protein